MARSQSIFGKSSKNAFKFSAESGPVGKAGSKRDAKFDLYSSEVKLPRRVSLPKVERKPIFGRATAGLADALRPAELVSGPPPQPETGPFARGLATKPEWYVNWGLVRNGKKNGLDYNYRGEVKFLSSLATAAQLDFTMIDGSQIAIEVQGIHWHYELGFDKIAQDRVRRTELVSAGWVVIQIDEDDALRDPVYYVKEALAGRDHSYSTNEVFYQPWT
jgi:very-short-patch-repair endonuclease